MAKKSTKKPTNRRKAPKTSSAKDLGTFQRIGIILLIIALGVGLTFLYRQINPKKPIVKCTTESCFKPEFKACNPATLEMTLGENAGTKVAVSYEILSAEKNGCKMRFEYTELPNPEWVNKPMTCTFDNTKDLQVAVGQTVSNVITGQGNSDCSGPLVGVLQSQAQAQGAQTQQ